DDKTTPPLQMADLVASIVKDMFLDWLSKGKPRRVLLEDKWHSHFERIGRFDAEQMVKSLKKTLESKRLTKGELPLRPRKMDKRERKQERRRMWRDHLKHN